MSGKPPLSDDDVYERLHAAYLALGREDGATVRGDAALKAARRAITLLQMGHLAAQDGETDLNQAIKAQGDV